MSERDFASVAKPENIPKYIDKCDIPRGWRGQDKGMTGLVKNLYHNPDEDSFTDVTFLLPDGSQLRAHKVIQAPSF